MMEMYRSLASWWSILTPEGTYDLEACFFWELLGQPQSILELGSGIGALAASFPFFVNSSLILITFLLDRISKIYVINLDKKFLGSEIFSSKYLNISLIWNEGIAFGLLSFDQDNLYNILTLLIILIIFFIFVMIIKSSGIRKYALLMILGGAFGNIFDRIIYRAVPDFIDFHIGDFHWFIFNVADIFITLGVVFMILLEFIDNGNNNVNKQKN